jgi:ATP synthase protein I
MSGNGTRNGRDEASGSSAEGDLSGRLERLGAQLDAKRPAASPDNRDQNAPSAGQSAIGLAFRLSAEFVAGVLAGGILGWLVDRWVGTAPWGLIVCLILGFAAGMLNLLRATGAAKPARHSGR